ncbi:hypothetical protein AUK22_00860 [bacterium CG2_30_54_10]|nr:MAG: hypothetical protein AUK22_00860 [bacterium CG2_30_54_10]
MAKSQNAARFYTNKLKNEFYQRWILPIGCIVLFSAAFQTVMQSSSQVSIVSPIFAGENRSIPAPVRTSSVRTPVHGSRIEGASWPIPLASEALYDLELVNMYAEFYPESYEASILADVYLTAGATDPVVLQCAGNFKFLSVSADQQNLAFKHIPPYFWLYNLEPGAHKITFSYRVRHDGFSTPGTIISTNLLNLDRSSFWYPRNIASDSHQVLLNLVTDPGYEVYSNASMTRDIPNNLKRLRTFLIANPSQLGLELRGTP